MGHKPIEGSNPSLSANALVAQLDRAPVYGTGGRRFESCRVRQLDLKFQVKLFRAHLSPDLSLEELVEL